MKKLSVIIIIIWIFCSTIIFANEQVTGTSDIVAVDLNKIILPYSFGSNFFWKLSDGTMLKTSEVRTLAQIVPENKTLLQQEKTWRIITYSLVVLGSGSAISGFIVDDSNLRIGLACGAVGICIAMVYSDAFANNRLQHAVNNYNLSIMGIPIGK
jgi:hypothetical protein